MSHDRWHRGRRDFWLRYISDIERTACLLDIDERRRLQSKLAELPELKGAIARAFPFTQRSDVQAFVLVFRDYVVLEFSSTGNAAYIYSRNYFSSAIESKLYGEGIASVRELKVQSGHLRRLLHVSNWQEKAEAQLAELGIHARAEHSPRARAPRY